MKRAPILTALILSIAAFVPSVAHAQTSPAITADCATMISNVEARRQIPRGLLMAIAVTESGLNGRPNPYAMNIAGRAYHANGVDDMARVISANTARGVRSIDVGCMQINLKYHGSKFASPLQLLDSATNVEYGASFIIQLAIASGSWREAVMSYHNKTNPARRVWYGCKVWNNYLRISGAQAGYLNCGSTPGGSSTASTPSRGQSPLIIAGYNAPAQPQMQTGPVAGLNTAYIGNAAVDVPQQRRVQGSITLAAAGQGEIPDIVNDDPRASAFHSVKPTDWSTRQKAIASQPDMPSTSREAGGFTRVTSGNE